MDFPAPKWCWNLLATLSKMDMQFCPKILCNFFQKGLAKNSYVTTVAKVYYILLGTEDREKIKTLYAKVKTEYPKVYISKFKNKGKVDNDVLTIYSPEEVGR